MTDRELMQQAFDAMSYGNTDEREAVRVALRDRLAQPDQEPVAWLERGKLTAIRGDAITYNNVALPLYTATPQRKPPQFPTMLRKMWSGAEVQKWINENWEQA